MSVAQITKLCTLKCTYCFDRVHQSDAIKAKNIMMERETFSAYIKKMNDFFHWTWEEKSICISGWEPTYHPDFIPMMNEAVSNWFKIYLLSNFTFDKKTQKYLKKLIDNWDLSSMTNINSPTASYSWMTKNFWERTLDNLEALQSPKIRVSINIFDPDIDYDFIIDTFKKFPKLDKTVRVGIENMILPSIRKSWEYVFEWKTWERYQKLWKTIDDFTKKLHDIWREIYLDCWAGWCIFENETIEAIKKNWWLLHPCTLTNDEVWIQWNYSACYAIHEYWNEDKKIKVQNTWIKRQRNHFILKTEFFKSHYLILPKCQKCSLLEKWCPRFCVSNNIFYWERAFKNLEVENWEIKMDYKDKFLDNYSNQEKNYSAIEFLIAKWKYEKAVEIVQKIDKDFRIKLYEILLDFITENIEKKYSFENFNNFMEDISKKWEKLNKKDFRLARFVDMLLKKYRKV